MPKRIDVGEKVLATTGYGPWGSRQFTGRLEEILSEPDRDGNKYVVEIATHGSSIHTPTAVRAVAIRRYGR